MKRLLSFIILLATINAGCMHTTFADFFAIEKTQEISMHHGMQMWNQSMQEEECCEMVMDHSMYDLHDCCGNALDYAIFQSEDEESFLSIEVFKYIDLAINFNISEINLIDQLNSPPNNHQGNKSKNQYFQLVWIIKNNA